MAQRGSHDPDTLRPTGGASSVRRRDRCACFQQEAVNCAAGLTGLEEPRSHGHPCGCGDVRLIHNDEWCNAIKLAADALHDDTAAINKAKAGLAAVPGAAAVTPARGSPAHVTPGSGKLACPVADRLFFAGDAVGGALSMSVGGAWRAGDAIVAALIPAG